MPDFFDVDAAQALYTDQLEVELDGVSGRSMA
jgi:hypothetical protein